jgi:hypothetical protein
MVIIREVIKRREADGGIFWVGVTLVGDSGLLSSTCWAYKPLVYYTLESSTILFTIELPNTLMTRRNFEI